MLTEVSTAQISEGSLRVAAAPLKAGQAVRVALGVIAALVIGVAVGAVTQQFPSQVIPASTSGGPWVLVSFLIALTAAGVASATARGLACMVGLAIGYYGLAALHGYPVSGSTAGFWVPVALLVGPLTGLAAGWIRSGSPLLAHIAAGVIPGVLLGEGFAAGHQLETLAGAGLMAGLLAWQVRRAAAHAPAARAVAGAVAVALAGCLAAGALVCSWYLATVPTVG